ncbi:hypothetical protein ACFU6S_18880 [Streptomyces sp. NPDC057456]|uniref:hypothetical protein n=1 Tax=Streptomyces sp. NPDC057456 TaxID=3346139 RepID=UPI0036BE2638
MTALVHASSARERSARDWLLLSAEDSDQARQEWSQRGVTVLRCGVLFDVVRVRSELVVAAAGTSDPEGVAQALADALNGCPVFADRTSGLYYCMVPPGTRQAWQSGDAACLGLGSVVGVPRPDLDASDRGARSAWYVPLAAPWDLCSAAAVQQFVHIGRLRQLQNSVSRRAAGSDE